MATNSIYDQNGSDTKATTGGETTPCREKQKAGRGKISNTPIDNQNRQNTENQEERLGRIILFADDTCLYLNGTNSLQNVIAVFEDFYRYAGLRLNIEKTEAILLGKTNRFGKICNIKITHKPIKVLGIWISK